MSKVREHLLERSQRLGISVDRAFEFFSNARNLELITPPWLRFRVTTPGEIELGPGALIESRLRVRGLPLRWTSRIDVWEPPRRFVDLQVRGPYALWEHTHTFEADGPEAVVIHDRVRYALPLGPVGRLVNATLVSRDLDRIFRYRREAVRAQLDPASR